jgi:hypothetical protein
LQEQERTHLTFQKTFRQCVARIDQRLEVRDELMESVPRKQKPNRGQNSEPSFVWSQVRRGIMTTAGLGTKPLSATKRLQWLGWRKGKKALNA